MLRTLSSLGENAFLQHLLPTLATRRDVLTGAGDDCAVTHLPGTDFDFLFTTDPLIEGRHYAPGTSPAQIGRKAIHRAISDIAAMGGTPRWLLIGLTAPPDFPLARIRAIYRALNQAAARWQLAIIGGDTAQSRDFALHVTAIGTAPHRRAVLRATARPGDALYVTGTLGGNWRRGSKRHLTFTPRIAEGAFLAEHRFARAMMDLSDGLSTDLQRLAAASDIGAELHAAAIPRTPRATLEDALHEGEDYELLFAVPPAQCSALEAAWEKTFPLIPLSRIGCCTKQCTLTLIQPDEKHTTLSPNGFQHFTK